MATLKLFGWAKELAGTAEASLPLHDGTSVDDAWRAIIQQFPALAQHRKSFLLAVNRAYADEQTVVRDGDEIAVIPPVSGG